MELGVGEIDVEGEADAEGDADVDGLGDVDGMGEDEGDADDDIAATGDDDGEEDGCPGIEKGELEGVATTAAVIGSATHLLLSEEEESA